MQTFNIKTDELVDLTANKLNDRQIARLAAVFVKLSPASTLELWKLLWTGEFAMHNGLKLHRSEGVMLHLLNAINSRDEEEKRKNEPINRVLASLERQVEITGQ